MPHVGNGELESWLVMIQECRGKLATMKRSLLRMESTLLTLESQIVDSQQPTLLPDEEDAADRAVADVRDTVKEV